MNKKRNLWQAVLLLLVVLGLPAVIMSCQESAYEDAYKDGYESGYEAGRSDGYSEGYEDCYNEHK